MATTPAIPARVFGVSGPAAPIVLLLRRGPTRWMQLVQWRTDTDTFTDGQWFHGQLYERRCSLSPDGQLFAYFVSKYGTRSPASETWTAISRPPYFTALALWPKGDAWCGGGVFQENRTLLLNHPAGGAPMIAPASHLRVVEGTAIPWFRQGEDYPIYPAILQQQGWQRVEQSPYGATLEEVVQRLPVLPKGRGRGRYMRSAALIWQKTSANTRFRLQQTYYGTDFNRIGDHAIMEWLLIDTMTKQAREIEQAEWADWDQRGRLLFTRQGQAWASMPDTFPQEASSLLDLNDRRFRPLPSPDWASQWP
jgi:hypothetical protein